MYINLCILYSYTLDTARNEKKIMCIYKKINKNDLTGNIITNVLYLPLDQFVTIPSVN
jgi:hypothetical protein